MGDLPAGAPTADQIRAYMDGLSNWGRWGADDVMGTLNHITPDKRREAAALVKEGRVVSCAWDIRARAMPGAVNPPQRYMLGTGLDLGVGPDTARPGQMDHGHAGAAMEFIGLVFHGLAITHIDALSHVFWERKMYNGLPASLVTDWNGATRMDVRDLREGVVTRGVLLDVDRARGRTFEPGEPVMPADLEAAEAMAGIRVEPGDVLLLRTGDGTRRVNDRNNYDPNIQPGYQAACLPWLHERGVAAIGSDVAQDVRPSGYGGELTMPIHTVGIVAMGLWLIDNCNLEELGVACAELKRWEFQFVLGPLRMEGGTGSPANPLAIF